MPIEQFLQIPSRGQTMRGMLHLPDDFDDFNDEATSPAVFLWHGFTGTHIEPHRLLVRMARRLAANGIVAARVSFIGSGDSDGEFVDVSPETEIEDALNALAWMRTQPGIDATRLGLIGLSLGGLVSACTAARSHGLHSPPLKALCLWAASAHMSFRLHQALTPDNRVSLQSRGFYDAGGNCVGQGFFDSLTRLSPLEEASKYFGAALVVHGSMDGVVPVAEAHEYARALHACDPKLHIIEGADHTFNRLEWVTELMDVTAEFLRQRL